MCGLLTLPPPRARPHLNTTVKLCVTVGLTVFVRFFFRLFSLSLIFLLFCLPRPPNRFHFVEACLPGFFVFFYRVFSLAPSPDEHVDFDVVVVVVAVVAVVIVDDDDVVTFGSAVPLVVAFGAAVARRFSFIFFLRPPVR